jgi:hypothetical protein
MLFPLLTSVIDTKVGPHPLDDMLQEKSTFHLGYFGIQKIAPTGKSNWLDHFYH